MQAIVLMMILAWIGLGLFMVHQEIMAVRLELLQENLKGVGR